MTSGTPEEAKQRAATTYNATSDAFDNPANSFWDRFGRRTIQRLNPLPGARILDVCCGSGASAIPAAETVAPAGSVLGVDLAEHLLDLARTKAAQRGLTNIEFRTGDMLDLGLDDGSFDAVVCVFGIFFVPDVVAATRALWRLVKPGAALAITTWGPRWCEPMNSEFWNAVRAERPELDRGFNPWDRITAPDELRAVLTGAGVTNPEIVPEAGNHPIPTPDDWWWVVLGTGYRATIEALAPDAQERVRLRTFDVMQKRGITEIEMNVVYALAQKQS